LPEVRKRLIVKLSIEEFYAHCKKGELLGLKCKAGHINVPPQPMCSECGAENIELVKLSGNGTVISFTQVFVASSKFASEVPYYLVLINLDEGGRLLGVLRNARNAEPSSGMKVRVKFEQMENRERMWPNWPRVFFMPL
jgi:uncharacterized OB-fold protein